MRFGQNIKRLREEYGLSQAELAEKLSVSEATINFFETDKRPPTYKVLNKILDLFNISADDLLGYNTIDPITFGKRLGKLRLERSMTMDELGAILNLKRYNISNYENGKRVPNLETVYHMAEYFQVSIDYLLGRVNNKSTSFSAEKDVQKKLISIGEYYIEFDKELKELGISPEKVLEILKALDSVVCIKK
ncbi:helix-turn-helix domain-containing protein [Wukongibacter baidiensis]